MPALKTGLNADKFATFWISEKILSFILLTNDPYTL